MHDFYGSDLARIHDEGFSDLATAAAGFALDLLRRRGIVGGRVLDLGCGAGHVSAAFAERGYETWGVDVSSGMVARARARVPTGTFVQASVVDVVLPPGVMALAVGEVLNYLPQRNDVTRVLRRVHRALEPDGILLFDVAGPGRGGPTGTRVGARVRDDWAVVASTRELPRQRLERVVTAFSRQGQGWRRTEERHTQLLYEIGALARLLRRVGFRVQVRRGYGSYRFGRDVGVLIARKVA